MMIWRLEIDMVLGIMNRTVMVLALVHLLMMSLRKKIDWMCRCGSSLKAVVLVDVVTDVDAAGVDAAGVEVAGVEVAGVDVTGVDGAGVFKALEVCFSTKVYWTRRRRLLAALVVSEVVVAEGEAEMVMTSFTTFRHEILRV